MKNRKVLLGTVFCLVAASLLFTLLLAGSALAGHPSPPGPAVTTMTIHVKASTLGDVQGACQSGYITQWQFVMNQIDSSGDAPSSIHVTWGNGSTADVALSAFTGKVGHYITTENPGAKVTDATAVIYSSWSGQFNLSDVKCAEPTKPVPETPTIGLLCGGLLVVGGMLVYRSRRNRSAQSK